MNFKNMPKIELHVHLDGSVRLETVAELSGKSIEEVKKEMVAPEKCLDLKDYLTKFSLPLSILQTKENLTRVSKELALDLKEDGVMYAEVRFAPILHTKLGLTLEEVVEAVLEGFRNTKLTFGLILCCMRNATKEENQETVDLAIKYYNHGVVGIDLAGDEKSYPTKEFKYCFERINKYSIPYTIHAGEASGKDSILSAIDFGANRLGHGIRIIDDIELIKLVIDKNIVLEICPTSNVQTNVVNNYQNHPLFSLYKQNILITINTDNRTISNVTLTDEYLKLQRAFSFQISDFKILNLNAIKGSFLSPEQRKMLEIRYIEQFEKFLNCSLN